jgi:hypothetical protein
MERPASVSVPVHFRLENSRVEEVQVLETPLVAPPPLSNKFFLNETQI